MGRLPKFDSMVLPRRLRYAVQIEGLSHREAARRFGIDPRTVARMMKFSAPPGYLRKKPPARPKLDPLVPVIRCTTWR
jgi:transposase